MSDRAQRIGKIAEVAGKDGRYKIEAYLFVIEALGEHMKRLGLASPEKRRHLSAAELLEGIKHLGWKHYGRLARVVFSSWGVSSGEDFGDIVFNLIEAGEFSKTPDDKKEDFSGVLDFQKDLVDAYPMGEEGQA